MRIVAENVSNALRSLASSWLSDEDEQMIRLAQVRCCIGPIERIARAGSCLIGHWLLAPDDRKQRIDDLATIGI
jgi:hypothetical protein